MSLASFRLFFRNNLIVTGFLVISGSFASCENDLEPLTANSMITGLVHIDDDNYEDPTDVKVVASGPYGQKSAALDAEKRFTISGLGNGTYYLDYYADGYGTVRQYGIQLFGNDTAHAEYTELYKLPPASFVIPEFINTTWVAEGLRITTDYTVQHTYWNVRLFFGLDNKVSYRNYVYTYGTTCNWNNELYVNPYIIPFPSGSRIYVIGYNCNQRDRGYLDTYTNERVFSTLYEDNHSNVISFTIP